MHHLCDACEKWSFMDVLKDTEPRRHPKATVVACILCGTRYEIVEAFNGPSSVEGHTFRYVVSGVH